MRLNATGDLIEEGSSIIFDGAYVDHGLMRNQRGVADVCTGMMVLGNCMSCTRWWTTSHPPNRVVAMSSSLGDQSQ